MKDEPIVAVVCGGTSAEREVSLGSGLAVAEAFGSVFKVERIELSEESVPAQLNKKRHVVFSTLHGTFGEDGAFQSLLEAEGIEYAGCDVQSSQLTFDKVKTKAVLRDAGIPVANQIAFHRQSPPDPAEAIEKLGPAIVVKPVKQGSSIGLGFANSVEELESLLSNLKFDDWMLETMIVGKELSVGVLDGKATEIVEIRPKSGQYDYASKYTKGLTEFVVPAPLPGELEREIKGIVERTFEACGCRDYARVDLMLSQSDHPFVLEVNTLPGMKETSLLPMSAAAAGINFKALLKKLVEPAFLRFYSKYSVC
jgi:D-alanine-D-alanine ligase